MPRIDPRTLIWEEKGIYEALRKGGNLRFGTLLNSFDVKGLSAEDNRQRRKRHLLALSRMIREGKVTRQSPKGQWGKKGYWNHTMVLNEAAIIREFVL